MRSRSVSRGIPALLILLLSAVAVYPLPSSLGWPTGLTPEDKTCSACHERAAFGVAATVTRVNGIDPEWGANRGGTVAVSPGGTLELEWRVTGLGYDYREVAGFIFVPDTAGWRVGGSQVSDNGRAWQVPWVVASSDERAEKHDNRFTWVTAYDHVHRAGDDGFPGGRGYGSNLDDGSALDLNGRPHDDYFGARIAAPAAAGNYTLQVGANGMPATLVNKGGWVGLSIVVAPVSPPRLLSTSPADGQVDVSVLDPLTLVFDRPMDRATTQAAFSLAPRVDGSFAWSADRTRASFLPASILGFATGYTLTLASSARDRSGVSLGQEIRTTFSTQAKPAFTVYLSSPRGGELVRGLSTLAVSGAVLGGSAPYSGGLRYSTDGGATYPGIIAPLELAQAGAFRGNWTVPAIDSAAVRVRATVKDAAGAEVSGHSRDLVVDSTPPRLLTTLPAAGEKNVSRVSPVVLEFGEPVDAASVETALALDPPAPGGVQVDGARATLQPAEPLFGSARYEVRVGGVVEDLVGNRLSSPANWSFETEPDWSTPSVVARSPAGRDVNAFTSITIRFNKLMDRTKTAGAFVLVPPVKGVLKWDLSLLTFSPDEGFAYSTRYNVTITTAATDRVGFHPEANASWEFTTTAPAPPTLVGSSPEGGDAALRPGIEAVFSDHMDQARTEAAFSISPEAACDARWEDRRRVVFEPREPLSGFTTYAVEFSKLARNTRSIDLASAVSWNFTTGPGRDTIPPEVVHVQPDAREDVKPLNITLAASDNVGIVRAEIHFRDSSASPWLTRPLDLYEGTPKDGKFRALFRAPLRAMSLDYRLTIGDADNNLTLPGGDDSFRVEFTSAPDTGFAAAQFAVLAALAPLAVFGALYARRRSRPRARAAPGATPPSDPHPPRRS